MLQLDANIVSVSLPSIGHSLHAGFDGIEWVITAYTLSFASLLMPAGALADRYGRKPALMLGLAVFTTASFFCGAAPNLAVLVAARAFQGVGAAMQLSAGLATLSHNFTGTARARAFSFWGSAVGAGICLGPIVGGLITQAFGWQWAFYINVPIGAAAIALTGWVILPSRDPHAVRLDLLGVMTFASFLFLTTLALISGNHDGWTRPHILAEALGAAVFLAAFIAVERGQARPMLDFSFFGIPTFLGGVIAQFTFAAALMTMLTYVPIYFQNAFGYPPGRAGLMMLPLALPLFVVPRLVTLWLAHRWTGRLLLTVGLALVSVGLAWMGMEALAQDPRAMLAGMLLSGVGAGLLNGETTKVTMAAIPPERAGMASGLSGSTRFTGLVVGFSVLGVVLYGRITTAINAALPATPRPARAALIHDIASGHLVQGNPIALHAFSDGYQALLLAGAALACLAALLVWRLVRPEDTRPV
jgi:EmrB/QacA subfamily drug resistance transporter